MLPKISLATADATFFDAIADRALNLESILSEHFVYRTRAASLLGKFGLINYLRSGRIRIQVPRILDVKIMTTDRTSVHQGSVRMTVHQDAESVVIHSDFLHVWVSSEAGWQLIYRETF